MGSEAFAAERLYAAPFRNPHLASVEPAAAVAAAVDLILAEVAAAVVRRTWSWSSYWSFSYQS